MKLFTSIAAACIPFVTSADSYGSFMDTAMDGDMAAQTATTAYALRSEPEDGTIIIDPDFPLTVEMASSEMTVKFQYVNPKGTESDWMEGESEPDSNVWTYTISSYVGPGTYSWKFMTIDENRNELISDSKTFEVDLRATQYGDLKQMIMDKINEDGSLAEGYVKLAYQDCLEKCDGCVNVKFNDDPHRLNSVIDSLEKIWDYARSDLGISRADVFTFAGLVGAEMSSRGDEEFPMEWSGRPNCEEIVYPCDIIDGSPIMCGPKVAPDYSSELVSSMASTADYGALTFSDLTAVQENGDVGLKKIPCDLTNGPCQITADDNYDTFAHN